MADHTSASLLMLCVFCDTVIKSMQVTDISIDPEMTRNRTSFIVCMTTTQITAGVFFYTSKDISKGGCLFPGIFCSSTIPGYSVIQNVTARTTTLIIDSVDCTRETGSWYCRHGSEGSSSATYVGCNTTRYMPVITSVSENIDVVENTRININCGGGTSPGNPQPSYVWTGPDGYMLEKALLDRTITRSKGSGLYTCNATNSVGITTAEVSVNVIYKPAMSGLASSYPVIESSSLQINCSTYTTPGNPSITRFRWTGPGNYISKDPLLAINNISRSQAGQYICTATNTLTPTVGPPQPGTATGEFQVVVQYSASITSFTVNSNSNTVTVSELGPIVIRCQVDSKPRSLIKLYNRSSELSGADNSLTIEHSWKPTCRQRGTYSCKASNGIGSSVTRSIKLVVTCSPKLVETFNTTTHYSSLGSNISLAVPFLSYPEPNVVWSKIISQRNLSSISYVSRVSDVSVTALLSLIRLQQEDLGEYMVQASNGVGQSVEHNLQLVLGSPPNTPTNFAVESLTSTSFSVSWRQEFNGGGDQTFTVEYSTDDLTWKEAWQIKETGRDMYLQMNITGLAPHTAYYVRVAASNQYGTTYTDSVRALTQKEATAAQAPFGLIAGVTIGVLVLVAVIIIVILLVRRGFKCVILHPGSGVVKNAAEQRENIQDCFPQEIPNANTYSELSDREPDRTAYTELKTYENTGPVADVRNTYEELQSRPSENKVYYEDIKPAEYENIQDATTSKQGVHEGNPCMTPVDNDDLEPHTYITVI